MQPVTLDRSIFIDLTRGAIGHAVSVHGLALDVGPEEGATRAASLDEELAAQVPVAHWRALATAGRSARVLRHGGHERREVSGDALADLADGAGEMGDGE